MFFLSLVDVLVVVMPLVYAGLVILYGISFFRDSEWAGNSK